MPAYLREHRSSGYLGRTKFNAESSDLTIAFTVDQFTAGECQTRKLAGLNYMHVNLNTVSPTCAARDIHQRISSQFASKPCNIINIAGNGLFTLSRHGWTQEHTNNYLFDTFYELKERWGGMPKKGFRSGGQTGVDIAAVVMAYALGADVVATFPKGYRQRGFDGQDFTQNKDAVMLSIITMSKQLKKEGDQS